ncbi:MAG TPA: hypothetical protein VM029_21390 [Opitutaceae bacterium]|nr:hypothetical protein [Opitutaceae bacterium]
MELDDQAVLDFVGPQSRDHGGKVELDAGLWTLFAVASADVEANAIAAQLLSAAPFAHESGESEDDRWKLYYVDTANRAAAIHWLEDLVKRLNGEIRPVSPAHRALLQDLIGSAAPHRVAQKLVDLHTQGELGAGAVREPAIVRAMLDRLHMREPLFFAAFHTLLSNHLIDMVVLFQQIITEDLELKNEIVKGGLSRDPFLQSRQDSATGIRNILVRFHVINALDQHKNNAIANPYAAYMELIQQGDEIKAPIDGTPVVLARPSFLNAIRAIRRNLARGGELGSFDTQAPWVREDIAYAFRFIKQRLISRRDLTPMVGLYMLERAVDA